MVIKKSFLNTTILSGVLVLKASFCFGSPPGEEANPIQSPLPECINSAIDIEKIQNKQKANQKTLHKYDGYRNALQTETAVETAARLVYAETLAANCPQRENQVAELVSSVIANRVRIRQGDIRSVIFQRDQFSSSLNIYSESRYRDFLCPRNADLWQKALTFMRHNLEQSMPSAPIPSDAVNYYLHRHNDRFKAPDWKLEEVAIADNKIRECISLFRNSRWG